MACRGPSGMLLSVSIGSASSQRAAASNVQPVFPTTRIQSPSRLRLMSSSARRVAARSAAPGHGQPHLRPSRQQPPLPTAAATVHAAQSAPHAEPVVKQQQQQHLLPSSQPFSGTVTSYEEDYRAPADSGLPLEVHIERLRILIERLRTVQTVEDKIRELLGVDTVAAFMSNPRHSGLIAALFQLPPTSQFLLLCLPAMGQHHVLEEPMGAAPSAPAVLLSRLTSLATRLARVEQFYDSLNGLLGYQLKSLQLIVMAMQEKRDRTKLQHEQQQEQQLQPTVAADSSPSPHGPDPPHVFHVPRGIDLAGEEGSGVGAAAAAQGLASLPFMAEIYPVGGSGDRLGLVDETTGESLPTAMLPYVGRTLLEVLLRDLQAREYLYFQLTGRQVTTPVAIMTSEAKGNHDRVSRQLAELNWGGRGPTAFRLFRQPMVPVISTEDGRWLLSHPMGPMMKPGGHGALWKLMWDEGVFEWLTKTNGRRAAIVRQISNPMSGMDTTLLALAGAGFARRGGGASAFGFMSCERAVGAVEGMNVLQERRQWVEDVAGGAGRWVYKYGVTNVEYTELERLGLNDEAVSANSKTSVFPANTNVLYVGLYGAKRIVAEAVAKGDGEQLLPGLIFNLNKKVSYTDPLDGSTRQVTAGRMESTMQNMADFLTDSFDRPLQPEEMTAVQLSTFLVSNLRRKVTSSAKKCRQPGSTRIAQTPEGSFYDLQRNAWQLLQWCGLQNVPEPGSPEQYLEKGPGLIFLYHPALGPLWDVISQKIMGGSLTHGSELVLEVAEARLQQVHLDGSLQIYAENVMGHLEAVGLPAAATATSASPLEYPGSMLAISSLHNGTLEMPLPRAVAHGGLLQQQQQAAADMDAGVGGMSPAPGAPGLLRFGRRCGRVQLSNVHVRNAGIDWQAPKNVYWKHQVSRHESCKIVLLGQSEFEAHDVTITGAHTFVVPDGFRLTVSASTDSFGLRTQLTSLRPANPMAGYEPSWEWVYSMDTSGAVRLSYVGAALRSPAAGMVATAMAAAERRGQYVLDFSI